MSREFIEEVARETATQHELAARSETYAELAFTPQDADWPTLHLDDVSGIPFLTGVVGVEAYQLRSQVRARQGDVYTATCPALADYEQYNTQHLGLGAPEFVYAETVGAPIEIANACRTGEAFEQLTAIARRGGRLLVHPYMGIAPVWELARELGVAAGVPVHVLAPPPPVTWLVNDKVDFTRLVHRLLGPELVVDYVVANDSERLARGLLELAARHEQVALKLARCASAMGNRVYRSERLLREPFDVVLQRVESFLAEKEWDGSEDLLTVAWMDTDCSPSSQLWIPPMAGGARPVIDGVYEQLLEGDEKIFLGSVPSRLGADIDDRIVSVSLRVAEVLQILGYVGRCSFDFIVPDDGQVRFVECNGRWGGTSTPMHLLDRLFPAGRPAYRARDFMASNLRGRSFSDLADALGDTLYDARTGQGSYVLYNVGCLTYGKFDVIAIGETIDDATRALEHDLPELVATVG